MSSETHSSLNRKLKVSVIIPTTCERTRATLLNRAIESATSQEHVDSEVLLVCNGNRQDPHLLSVYSVQSGVRIIQMDEGNVSKARHLGIRHINSEYFCFLDDDDELLPGCLYKRLKIMECDPECDVLVTNGLIHITGTESPLVPQDAVAGINADLCITFLRQNWFASPASMFRAQRVSPDMFSFDYKYFEWTYLFFSLVAKQKKIVFDETITYRKYEDNPLSVSKSNEYLLAYPGFLNELKQLDLSKRIKKSLHNKYVAALNSQSNIYRQQGQWLKAWKSHISCIAHGGLRYIPYTRHLLFLNIL